MTQLINWRLRELAKHCPQNNNWIFQLNFEQIISHHTRKVQHVLNGKIGETEEISDPELLHIYFNHITAERLTALVAIRGKLAETQVDRLVLIDNTCEIEMPVEDTDDQNQEDENGEIIRVSDKPKIPIIKGVNSTLTYLSLIGDLTNRDLLSRRYQKTVGIDQWWNKCLEMGQKKVTTDDSISHFGFLSCNDIQEKTKYANEWIKQSGAKLDFTGNYVLTGEEMLTLPKIETVKHVIFDQNCQITNFQFLRNFPDLRILELRQCQQIDDVIFRTICQSSRNLEAVILQYNICLNVRVFLPLLQLQKIRLIKVDYPNFQCQISPKEVLMSREEWKSCHSFSLEQLEINSESMTLDVLDYLLKACQNLKTIYLSEETLQNVAKNVTFDESNSREEDQLNFHLMNDPRKGLRVSKPVRFKNMFKDYITAPFSKSMLEKIKQNSGQQSVPTEIERAVTDYTK